MVVVVVVEGGSKYYGHNKMTPPPSPNLALQNQRCFYLNLKTFITDIKQQKEVFCVTELIFKWSGSNIIAIIL